MYKYFKVLLVLVFICSTSHSQNKTLIDSLRTELKNRTTEDSIKVSILTLLHEKLMFSKPEEAKFYALEELRISRKIDYPRGLGIGNMHLGNYFSNRSENDSALFYYNKGKEYFKKTKNTRGIIFVNHSLASIMRINGELDEAILLTNETLQSIRDNEQEGDLKTKFIGAQYATLANIYIEKGNYKIALTQALQALKSFEEIDHQSRKADALKQIGDIESALGNYKNSIDYFTQAINIYEKLDDKMYLAYAHNSLGISHQNLDNLEEAKANFEATIVYSQEVGNKATYVNALHNLGALDIINKNFTQAKVNLVKGLEMAEAENLQLSKVNFYHELSKLYLNTNAYSKANDYNLKAIAIAKDMGALPHLKSLYKFRSKLMLQSNKGTEAVHYLTESQKIGDSLLDATKSRQIEELKTIYETQKKESEIAFQKKEIQTLNQEVEISNLRKGLYGFGMVALFIMSGLLYFGFKQRIKRNKIAREKQEEIYKQEIEFKKKELASQTLHLVQKNTFIQELKENLEKIKHSPELFKVEFRRLVMLLKKESAEDKDWEIFKSYFAEVHNNFDEKIKSIAESITEKEIRLAAFIRMNLSTKEIASMLNVQPDSVKKSKYRLKSKLDLGKDDDLTQFLNTL